MIKKLEIACFSKESAFIAAEAGADRIEFCSDYNSGGITPSVEDFRKVRKQTGIPVYVMIRPRAGDFVYSPEEIFKMKSEIKLFSEEGADGFVFGVLNTDRTVNSEACFELMNGAGKHPCTFHRAFDRCVDPMTAASRIISCRFTSVLSSGMENSALQGAELLKRLIDFTGGKLNVIAGGGVRSSNIEAVCRIAETEFYHSSGIVSGIDANRSEIEKMKEILRKCSTE